MAPRLMIVKKMDSVYHVYATDDGRWAWYLFGHPENPGFAYSPMGVWLRFPSLSRDALDFMEQEH